MIHGFPVVKRSRRCKRRERRQGIGGSIVMAIDVGSLLIQLFSGLSRAMMSFLLSSGLSLIFGVMNILNFAHATL